MPSAALAYPCSVRQDGFGTRRIELEDQRRRVEVLEAAPALATAGCEQAIRTKAGRLADLRSPFLAPVLSVTRAGRTLSIASSIEEGITLGDLLVALESGRVRLTPAALIELVRSTVRAVAEMHHTAGGQPHGALSPTHVRLRRDGRVMLTGTVFADALELLQLNREQLWRTYAIALPPSAGLPRFDVRSDVTQLGAVALATLLGRTLAAPEYPHAAPDLVAALGTRYAGCGSALRMWLQQMLQLHTKTLFASAGDAAAAYRDCAPSVSGSRSELRGAVARLLAASSLSEVGAN